MLACRRKKFWVSLFELLSISSDEDFTGESCALFYETRKPVDVQA